MTLTLPLSYNMPHYFSLCRPKWINSREDSRRF